MADWLPVVEVIPGNDSGTWAPDNEDAPKIVLHTTEGIRVEDAVSAYEANNSWPHLTVDPLRRRIVQHVPFDRPARALKNTSTPGQTNREGRVFQIEIVATSKTKPDHPAKVSVTAFTRPELEWLGEKVVGPVARATGTPLVSTLKFYGDQAGFTLASENARQRLTPERWDTYTGILGHQHVPENTHWDPGPLDVARIIAAAGGTDTQGGGFMADLTEKEQREALEILRRLDNEWGKSLDDKAKPPNGNSRWKLGKMFLRSR